MKYIQTPYGPKTPQLLCDAMDAYEKLPTLRAQRDELLAALEVISGDPRRDDTYAGMSPVQIARHALRKVS